MRCCDLWVLVGCLGFVAAPAQAQSQAQSWLSADQGKLPLTAGFSDVEGAGGGGLVPWATITGYGTNDSWGGNAHLTTIQLRDYELTAWGLAVGAFDRVELSYARHSLDVTGTALDGLRVRQDVYGVKVKLFGDAVYNQDSAVPQVAVGAMYKRNKGIDDAGSIGLPGLVNPKQLGAKDDSGIDYYVAATKVFLAQSVLVNVTARYTEANQFGLLGFGSATEDRSIEFEGTLAYIFNRKLAAGAEFRTKPDNLAADEEDSAWDVFVAWTPTRNISLVAAYLNLGSILAPVTAQDADQDGLYASLQVGF
jgi:hypothetical protein